MRNTRFQTSIQQLPFSRLIMQRLVYGEDGVFLSLVFSPIPPEVFGPCSSTSLKLLNARS